MSTQLDLLDDDPARVDRWLLQDLVDRLDTLPEFPRTCGGKRGIADLLLRLCRGATYHSGTHHEHHSPEQQWRTITQAIRAWPKWLGEREVIVLYAHLYQPPAEISLGDPPPISCPVCRDWGFHKPDGERIPRWCICPRGQEERAIHGDEYLNSFSPAATNPSGLQRPRPEWLYGPPRQK